MNLYGVEVGESLTAQVWDMLSDGVREKSFADFSLAPMMLNSNDLDTVVLGEGSWRKVGSRARSPFPSGRTRYEWAREYLLVKAAQWLEDDPGWMESQKIPGGCQDDHRPSRACTSE